MVQGDCRVGLTIGLSFLAGGLRESSTVGVAVIVLAAVVDS
jgi:hypothetical protein